MYDLKNLVTIVTVVYNDVTHIEETILSAINQSYLNREYIVLDGGSVDGTIDVIKKYGKEISFWLSENDQGIYDAMNKAVRLAHGEWIIFMNSGDVFYDENVLKNIFESSLTPSAQFIYSDFYVKTKNGLKMYQASYDKGILLHQSVIYKKALHDELGYYLVTNKYMVSDYIFFMLIPYDAILKVPYIISINEEAGVSSANWCGYQRICCDYIFSRISFSQLLFGLMNRVLRNFIKKIGKQ